MVSAACYDPGTVERFDGRDHPFHIGEQVGPPQPRTHAFVQLLDGAGVGGAGTVDDLIAERWAKLTVNCYGNALGEPLQRKPAQHAHSATGCVAQVASRA